MPVDCPCQSGKPYAQCCQCFHEGALAENAEQLMRSRYSAFVLELDKYLRDSWHPSTRPAEINFSDEPKQKWLGLQIRRHLQTDDSHAIVEFVARYTINGRAHRLHETSHFIKDNNRWYYVDGQFA